MRLVRSVLVLFLVPLGVTAQSVEADDAIDENIRQFAERMIEVANERSVPGIQETLVNAGLSTEDSERIAKGFADGMVHCFLDAVQQEADEQGLALEDVLPALEEALRDSRIEEPTIVDMRRVDEKAESCLLVKMQEAGISTELLIQQHLDAL